MLKKEQMQTYFIKFKNNDQEAKQIIIVNLMELSDNLINKYFSSVNIEVEELKSCCYIGISNAMHFYTVTDDIYFLNYAGKCIYNELMIHLNKEKLNNINHDTNYINKISTNLYNEFEEKIEDDELIDLLHQKINKLDKRKQTVVTLYYGLNNSPKYNQTQIATLLNISQSQVHKLLVVSLKDLQKQLINHGYDIHTSNLFITENYYIKKHR